MRRVLITILASSAACLAASPASASLVYDATATLSAQGFGSVPRDLTIQGNGNATIEGGCVGVTSTGGINVGGSGSCLTSDVTIDGNATVNTLHDETPP